MRTRSPMLRRESSRSLPHQPRWCHTASGDGFSVCWIEKIEFQKMKTFSGLRTSLMQICVRGFHHVRRCVWSALGGTFKAKELVGNLGGWNGLGGASKDPLQKGDPKNPSPNWSSHCRCSSRWAACSSCWSKIWVQGFLSAGTHVCSIQSRIYFLDHQQKMECTFVSRKIFAFKESKLNLIQNHLG